MLSIVLSIASGIIFTRSMALLADADAGFMGMSACRCSHG